MKRKWLIILTITILLCAFLLAFVACDDAIEEPAENTITNNSGTTPSSPSGSGGDSSTDPSKTEETPMENYETITVRGLSGETAVLNPAFDWTAVKTDAKYKVTVTDATGRVADEGEVTTPHYELTARLDYDKTYTVVAVGQDSKTGYKATFKTAAGSSAPNIATAEITLAEPNKSHMVLQRGKEIKIGGKTTANLLLTMDFFGARYYATSDEGGNFTFIIPAQAANKTPGNIEIRLLKNKKVTLEDVLIGDVFLVSGQSNVQRTLTECSKPGETPEWAGDVEDARAADVRYYYQAENALSAPSDSTKNAFWGSVTTNGENYKQYSAVAFMVGAMVGKELAEDGVPVGIVYAAKGNTGIANWMGSESTNNQHYNGMIYPLRNAEIKGVVWYQGCNNSAKGIEYEGHLTALMANWRALFRNETLPFYVVQLPCYDGDSGNNYDFSYVRESQLKACQADDNAYLIATCDGGERDEIHPVYKRYLCERIAKSILSTLYGADYLPQGPTYKSHVVEGESVVITVDNGEGLYKTGEEIVGFMLAGADGKYFDATATIENGKIVVTSDKVAAPVYIKYGFSKSPFLNVYNKDGYLMSPFRTDDRNRNIDLLDYREDATYDIKSDGSAMTHSVVDVDGEIGLRVTKANDGKDYGAVQLVKWGAIGYKENAIKFTVVGTGSGAEVLFRIVEGSWEIWAISFIDNFVGKQELTAYMSDFKCVYNNSDEIIDYQAIMYLEVMIKISGEASTTILGAKFVDVEETAPRAFTLKEAKNDGHECTIKYGFSTFATSYRVIVSADGTNFTDPILDATTDQIKYVFDPALCAEDVDYYVKVIALNAKGETLATGSGMLMSNVNRYTIASFDFASDEEFNAYKASNIVYKSKLVLSRSDKGLKINVHESDSWAHCIIKTTNGANSGFDALKFYMDLTAYKGDALKIQLQDQYGSVSFTYTLNFSSKKEGYFVIPLSSFTNPTYGAYTEGAVGRIAFNFTDYVGGDADIVYLDDLEYIKL